MKKKLLLLASLTICTAIITSGTVAYFTAKEQVHNVITTDAVAIDIEEWQEDEDGDWIPYPDEPVEIMPSETVSKIATVKNLEAECYIRAMYKVKITDANGKVMDLDDEEVEKIITVHMNNEKWQCKNGEAKKWWYYSAAVGSGKSTEPLFTSVSFDGPNMTNEYQNCTVEVEVVAQAIQTANNGNSAIEVGAEWWPEN